MFFEELHFLIKEKTGKQLLLSYVSNNTVQVGYDIQVKIPFLGTKSKNVTIRLTIDEVKGNDLFLHYSSQIMGGDMLISALTSYIPSIRDTDVIDFSGTNVIVHLNKIDKFKETLTKVRISSIYFEEEFTKVDFTPVI